MGILLDLMVIKTTVEIADSLLARGRKLAREQNLTLGRLTEEGLRMVLEERSAMRTRAVKPVTCRGNGLSPEFRGATWERSRDSAYDG